MSNHPASNAAPLGVRPVRAFADNYIWLIEAPAQPGAVVAVDPGDAEPVEAELDLSGSRLAAILLTHHHPDHIGGVSRLLERGTVPGTASAANCESWDLDSIFWAFQDIP
jgi:glyoxylase-like metal-dependent hydrolase (beta-lactamase superfamily II)